MESRFEKPSNKEPVCKNCAFWRPDYSLFRVISTALGSEKAGNCTATQVQGGRWPSGRVRLKHPTRYENHICGSNKADRYENGKIKFSEQIEG